MAQRTTPEVKNRRAGFEYHLLDSYVCGMVLQGSEIKSIRANGASINEAFCAFAGPDLVVRNMQLNPYGRNPHFVHEPNTDRKPLLHRTELAKPKRKPKPAAPPPEPDLPKQPTELSDQTGVIYEGPPATDPPPVTEPQPNTPDATANDRPPF